MNGEKKKDVDAGDIKYGIAFIIVIAFVIAIFTPSSIISMERLGILDRIAIMVVSFYFGRAGLPKLTGGSDAPKG